MQQCPVLIVDDDCLVLLAVARTLQNYGFEVVSTQNGQEALDYSQSNPVQLIITDMNMAIKNGIELIGDLIDKEDTTLIIAMSGDPVELQKALAAGAVDTLLKPFSSQELIMVVQNAILNNASN